MWVKLINNYSSIFKSIFQIVSYTFPNGPEEISKLAKIIGKPENSNSFESCVTDETIVPVKNIDVIEIFKQKINQRYLNTRNTLKKNYKDSPIREKISRIKLSTHSDKSFSYAFITANMFNLYFDMMKKTEDIALKIELITIYFNVVRNPTFRYRFMETEVLSYFR